MKKASRNRKKQTNKRKKHDSQPASLPPTFPPQSTPLPSVVLPQWPSHPPNIPPPSTSLPPGFPPLSTSLPPSFFTIPPFGTNTSLDSNIVPTPRINSSSNCHISQNESSSSQLPSSTPTVSPASSTPNISRSNTRVSISASPSTSTTTASACLKTQNIGETREYDVYHRLILTPDEDGFAPSYAGSHMISESIQPFFNDAWGRWKDFPYNIREQIWNQFRTKCTWEPCYENKINSIFEKKARVRISDMCLRFEKRMRSPIGYEKKYGLNLWRNGTLLNLKKNVREQRQLAFL